MTGAPVTGSAAVLRDLRRLPRTLVAFVGAAVRWVLIEPIRDGHLRLRGRPGPVRMVALGAILVSVAAVVLVVFAGPIRRASDLSVSVGNAVFSFPRPVLGVIVLAVTLSIACFAAGGLNVAGWLRVVILAATVLVLAFVGSTADATGDHLGLAIGLVGAAIVATLYVVRWRVPAAWWEFVVVLAVVVGVFAFSYARQADAAARLGLDAAPQVTGNVLRIVRLIAVPVAVVAGLAVAKVALSAMTLVTDFSGRRLSRVLFLVGALGLLAWRTFTCVRGWIDDPAGTDVWRSSAGSALALVAVLTAVVAVRFAARRVGGTAGPGDAPGDAPGAPATATVAVATTRSAHADAVALPAAVLLSITIVPLALVLMLEQVAFSVSRDGEVVGRLGDVVTFLSDGSTVLVTRVAAGVLLVLGGVGAGRRRHRVAGELAAAAGALLLVTLATDAGALLDGLRVDPTTMDRMLVSVIAVATVVWIARGTFGVHRQSAVVLALLVSLLVHERDFVGSPLTAVVGSAGIALVLFGFVWNFVADAGGTRVDSDRYPRDAKLFLFLAQALIGFAALAWVALARDAAATTDLGSASALGDQVLGGSLLMVVAITLIGDAIARPAPGDDIGDVTGGVSPEAA